MLEKNDKIGEYNLVKFLGRGQFGEVWLAEKKLQFSTRSVSHALKFLANPADDASLRSIEAEVDTWIEAGGHPNVMSVIDMFVANDHIVIISEYAEGGSLGGWLKRSGGKAPSDEAALEMMSGILRGIEHLHFKNVVHRDLKPDNILLQGNFPRITDFGISRIVSSGMQTTKPIGSPAYMSPDAFTGSKSPQTDIWSAGVMLYEMLTGKQPYEISEDEPLWFLVKKIQEEEPKPLPEHFNPALKKIVENALQKDAAKRFQTATEMRLAVERATYSLNSEPKSEIKQKHIATESLEEFLPTIPDVSIKTEEIQKDAAETVTLLTNKPAEKKAAEKNDGNEKKETQASQKTYYPFAETENSSQETQASPTVQTNNKEIENTVNWQDANTQDGRNRQAEISAIGEQLQKNRTGSSFGKKKGAGFYAGIFGGLIGVSLIGFLILNFSGGENKPAAVSNTAKTNSNTDIKPEIPTAPDGMAYVPGGEFMMGRDDGKSEAEKPAHKVSVQPFYMDIYEVTIEQYENPKAKGKGLPKVGVNWQQADSFCRDNGKRLPTEAEWEYAAGGANGWIYPWGGEWIQQNANVGGKDFSEVGKFRGASPFGIYDMSGNAWEWTADDFKAYPNGKLPEAFAGRINLKTIRGGSFEATKDFATITYRIGWAATGAVNYDRTGFRCVQDYDINNQFRLK